MRRQSKRAFEWSANGTIQAVVDDITIVSQEWGESFANGGVFPKASPGTVNPDIKCHRVLFNLDFLVRGTGGAPPQTAGAGISVTVGILETEFDETNATFVGFDPSYTVENQDAEWLWIYNWQLDDDFAGNQGVAMYLSELKVGLKYEFDVQIRRRSRGASVNMKRRDLLWVFSSDIPQATGSCLCNLNYRVLLSVPK